LVIEVTLAVSGEKWRWADPQGVQRLVLSDELRSALATGALPPYTLVWREGMAEWQPAYLVPDLAPAPAGGGMLDIPPPPMAIVAVQEEWERQGSGLDGSKKPEPKKKEVEPPPPPIHKYAAIIAAVPAHIRQAAEAKQPAPVPNVEPAPLPKVEPARVPKVQLASGKGAPVADAQAGSPRPPVVVTKGATPSPPETAGPGGTMLPAHPHAVAPPTSLLPSLPGSRASGPPPPPRQHHPAPVSHAPPTGLTPLAPPTQTRSASGPAGPLPAKTLLGIAGPSPIVVPAPQAFPPASITQSPPFGGNGEAAPVPPAPSMPEASTLGMPQDQLAGPPSRPSGDLPAFPLDEIEIDEDDDHSPASRSLRRGMSVDRGVGEKIAIALRSAQRALGPLAQRAKEGALRAKAKAGPAIVEGFAYIKANPQDPKVMAGLGGTALLVLLGLGAIAMSAGSKKHDDGDDPAASASASTTASAAAVAAPTSTESAGGAAPSTAAGACRLTKEAVRIAAKASKDVPLELAITAGGERARIGFSTDASAAQGLSVDLASFKIAPEFAGRAYKVRAVLPMAVQGKSIFVLNFDSKRDRLAAWRTLSVDPPMVVGWADNAVAVAAKPVESPRGLWTLDGDALPDTIRSVDAGDQGVAVVFRRRGGIFGGVVGKDRAPRGGLTQIAGAGAPEGSPVGSPTLAASGSTVAVAFADRASTSDPWSVRIGAAPIGSFPAQTTQFAVPPGGPGGAAIAPALAGLGDGRFLLAWTEGSGGSHDVRAQTLSADMKPVGAAFSVSHSGGNAGQGAAAVSAGKGLVAYLALTDRSYEVWGAGVDCR
jgi:hypothetical protein